MYQTVSSEIVFTHTHFLLNKIIIYEFNQDYIYHYCDRENLSHLDIFSQLLDKCHFVVENSLVLSVATQVKMSVWCERTECYNLKWQKPSHQHLTFSQINHYYSIVIQTKGSLYHIIKMAFGFFITHSLLLLYFFCIHNGTTN